MADLRFVSFMDIALEGPHLHGSGRGSTSTSLRALVPLTIVCAMSHVHTLALLLPFPMPHVHTLVLLLPFPIQISPVIYVRPVRFGSRCVVRRANVVVVVGLAAAVEERESGLFKEENSKRSDVLFAGIASGWSGASSSKLDSDSDSSAASSISSS